MVQRYKRLSAIVVAFLISVVLAAPALASSTVDAATRNRIIHGYNTTSNVWLTFDDCGSNAQFSSILNTLKKYHVKGRFFLNGTCLPAHPAMISRIKNEGHFLENHGYQHYDMTKMSDSQVLYQIDHGPKATSPIKLLRPPYGAGAFTTRLYNLAASRSYRLAFWSVDSCDWSGVSASTIISRIRSGGSGTRCGTTPKASAGGVVLMHVLGKHTAEALPGVITSLQARSLRLEPIS
jgi:peptidoglycan/xylan/chitin deacetylase (PgdA/CDA1 family)